ncbi:hypothetical protein MPS_1111 [Mycobacterium pseudoshottsii JCM 15466]|nr:hypothetical protein MMSP_5130 [Mycobacterium sp. 012931]GAQ32732.1 hypothetical protein MPS_1111 [Mycobacterium pseudoshottsii JCM 15466]
MLSVIKTLFIELFDVWHRPIPSLGLSGGCCDIPPHML